MSSHAPSLESFLKAPIFRGLNEAECRQLAAIATVEEFSPGKTILRQGKSSQNLWVVLEGICEVVKHNGHGADAEEAIVLAVLEPYNQFGEMSFLKPAPHSASVRAKTAVRLLRIKRSHFDKLVQDKVWGSCKVTQNIVESLSERLRRMDEWVAELLAEEPPKRNVPEWHRFRDRLFDGWKL